MNSDDLKELYKADYAEKFDSFQSPDRLNNLLPRLELNNDMTVLDVGCGSGMLMQRIHSQVKQYIGVDFSEDFISIASKHADGIMSDNIELVCSDVNVYCKSNPERFDAVFAMDISEHVYDEDWLEILISLRSALKVNGALYLHTPNAGFFLERMKSRNFLVKQFEEHVAVRNVDHNLMLLEQAGLAVESVSFIKHYNLLGYLHYLSYLPFMRNMFSARLFIKAFRSRGCD